MKVVKKRLRKDRVFLLVLLLFFSTIFIFSAFKVIEWLSDNNNTDKVIEKINSDVKVDEVKDNENTEVIDEEPTEPEKVSDYFYYITYPLINVDFESLLKTNNETVGWINVNNTNINYPFVQGINNTYYLNHSFDKSYNSAGWVFMDYRNNKEMNNKNTILYAHGRIDKTMFGSLYKTQYPAWYQNRSNHIIRISTPSVNMSYQIFSVYKIEEESYYIQTDFTSDDVYLEFLNTIKERSKYDFNVVLGASDKIITLSTCANDKERYVVHAKLIKKSER